MTAPRDTDRLIRAFLEEGRDELPDRTYDAVRAHIDHTRQRVVIGPWREEQMSKYAGYALAAAAVVLIAVVGIRFLPGGGGVGGQPSPTPSPTPVLTPSPTPVPTPVADPHGRLAPGTYVAHPFGEPNRAISFTFDVPSNSWESISDPGRMFGVAKAGDSEGMAMNFLRVNSLNGDPCNWAGTADDVEVGSTVDDLVAALTSAPDYETSEPANVTLGGYSGKKLVITLPEDLLPGGNTLPDCDENTYVIWNTDDFNIYAQGPENRWTLWILDVEGEPVVIQVSDFANSAAQLRQELQSMAESVRITVP